MSRRPLPNALDLDLRGGLTDTVTPHAGVALLIDLGRRSGVSPAADRPLPPKQSAKGLGHGQFVEAFVLLAWAPGKACSSAAGRRSSTSPWVTNNWDTPGQACLEWQRGKAGTIEHVNYILKDELAAGVYPSNKFGANTAWLRLQVLTHNLLELLKATALDPEYCRARLKRLRFAILTQFGRVVRHAREQYLRVVTRVLAPGLWRLQCCAWPVGP